MAKRRQAPRRITRRQFVKGAAAGAVGVAATGGLAGCAVTTPVAPTATVGAAPSPSPGPAVSEQYSFEVPPPPIAEGEIKQTETADVVVLGAGNAGLAATVSAMEAGAKTILLQKVETISGAGGFTGMVGSRLQKALNIRIDRDLLVAELMQWGTFRNDQSVVTLWADRSGEVMDWIMDMVEEEWPDLTVVLEWDVKDGFYRAFPISHQIVSKPGVETTGMGPSVRDILLKKAEDLGADIRYSTPAVQLVRPDNTGRVTGVIAQNADGEYLQFNATKGVIVCTGGYAQDIEMLQAYCPRALYAALDQPMTQGVTGDGIKMGMWIGAGIDDLPHAPMNFDVGLPTDGVGYPWTGDRGMEGFSILRQAWLRVNLYGERFVNEDQPYQYNLNAVAQQPGKMWWGVWDSNWREHVKAMHTTG